MTDCEHGGYEETCPPCRKKAGKSNTSEELTELFTTAIARSEGECPICYLPIEIEDPISHTDEGWVHSKNCYSSFEKTHADFIRELPLFTLDLSEEE